MRWAYRFLGVSSLTAAAWLVSAAPAPLRAQSQPQGTNPLQGAQSIESINEAFGRELLQIEQRRLERLAQLAASQNPAEAAATYEQLFQIAITDNLFREAEPFAQSVVKSGSSSPTVNALAYLVKTIAEADRGAFDQSLESLKSAVVQSGQAAANTGPRTVLTTAEKLGLCDAYFQRLIHAGQIDIALRAFSHLKEQARDPALIEFLTNRVNRLEMVGQAAPAIRGNDLDGKPFDLASARGKVVLVVFWASWSLPSAAEIEDFRRIVATYRNRGLEIVGINLDAVPEGGETLEAVRPNIRRFILDYNVTWPNLVNGSNDQDFAKAYHVTEVPANVLIDREGRVVQLDLVRKNLESAIAQAVGR